MASVPRRDKGFFDTIPPELEDAARIDGCSELGTLVRIVLPLSKAALATIALFYAVGYWNDFFTALLYLNNSAMWPLPMVLRLRSTESAPGANQAGTGRGRNGFFHLASGKGCQFVAAH